MADKEVGGWFQLILPRADSALAFASAFTFACAFALAFAFAH